MSTKKHKRPGKPGSDPQPLGYGWLPDPPDQRDLLFRDLQRPGNLLLPSSVDWSCHQSPVEHQGQTNSCTGHAVANILEFIRRGQGPIFGHTDMSRLFFYYNGRWLSGVSRWDTGAYIRDVIKGAVQWGCAEEKHWPFSIPKLTTRPSDAAYREAEKIKIKDYSRLNTVDEMRQCLAQGHLFVFGFSVYTSFTTTVARTGVQLSLIHI